MAEWIGNALAGLPGWIVVPVAILSGLIACAWYIFVDWPSRKKEK